MVPFIGLTGGIGAGKSTALDALHRLGAETVSTDQIVHQLYRDPEVMRAVTKRFGADLVSDGRIDRATLATRAFATPVDREWLEGLLWPRVAERIFAWREELARRESPPRAAVVEVPLLFEAGMEGVFDDTIAVIAEEELRAARAGGRGHAALEERAARQLSQQEKAARAGHVVVNDGTVAELESELSDILEKLSG